MAAVACVGLASLAAYDLHRERGLATRDARCLTAATLTPALSRWAGEGATRGPSPAGGRWLG